MALIYAKRPSKFAIFYLHVLHRATDESDLARLGVAAPSRRTISSAAAKGLKPLCFLPPVPPACCAATDDDEVGDNAAEAPTE